MRTGRLYGGDGSASDTERIYARNRRYHLRWDSSISLADAAGATRRLTCGHRNHGF